MNTTNLEFYSNEDLKLKDEEWKVIKDRPKYEISNYGRVRNKETKKLRSPFINRQGYLRFGLNPNKTAHRAVAENFLTTKPLKTVNHKDGNKFNNHISNLEWMSHKENINHAVDTSIRTFQHEVKIIDLETKSEQTYPSLNRVKELLDIHSETIFMYAKRSKQNPILNRYVVEINPTFFNTYNNEPHYVYDYLEDKWMEFTSKIHTSYELGVNRTSLSMNVKKNPKPYVYIGGYFITTDKNIKPIKITKEKAMKDRLRIESNTYNPIKRLYYVYDYDNNVEHVFDNIQAVCKFVGNDNANAVGGKIIAGKKTGITRLVNGYGVKDSDMKDVPWHNYSGNEILASKLGGRNTSNIYKYNDKYYINKKELIKDLGITNINVESSLFNEKIKKYNVEVIK